MERLAGERRNKYIVVALLTYYKHMVRKSPILVCPGELLSLQGT